jgi:AraC-like DNA-binding protein
VDLGSAPGGWSQVFSEINRNGKNLSIDILDMDKITNIFFYKKDFNDSDFFDFINNFFDKNKVDVVLYLRRLRMQTACQLLVTSRLALAQVADRCGFADQSHFTRDFRSLTGMTPRAYRIEFTA